MIQFRILSGKAAGTTWVARRFPVRIGRAPQSDLCLEENGVWNQHAVLQAQREAGFVLTRQGDALARVNGEPIEEAVLRNGDGIEVGSVKLQFWLSETRQAGLLSRETPAWAVVAAITAAQCGLLYWLLR